MSPPCTVKSGTVLLMILYELTCPCIGWVSSLYYEIRYYTKEFSSIVISLQAQLYKVTTSLKNIFFVIINISLSTQRVPFIIRFTTIPFKPSSGQQLGRFRDYIFILRTLKFLLLVCSINRQFIKTHAIKNNQFSVNKK